MTDQTTTGAMHKIPETDNTMVLRVPKPNMQVVILGLVAFITLFQTVQLIRISAKSGSAPVKTAPADIPAMQGGC